MRTVSLIEICALVLALPGSDTLAAAAGTCPQPSPQSYAPFDPARLSESIRTLASDEYGGREPGSHGEQLTLELLIKSFAAAGLHPAGDHGGWTQAVPMRRFALEEGASLRWHRAHADTDLTRGIDWVGASLAGESVIRFDHAPVVFVGYGVSAPERGWDDYKGVDLHGKVAVYLINDPDFESPTPGKFGGRAMTYYGRWTYKYEEAARRGAIAALIIHEEAAATYGWTTVRNSWSDAQFDIVRPHPRADHPLLEGWLSHDAAANLFQGAGLDIDALKRRAMREDFAPVTLPQTRISMTGRVSIDALQSHNVIGLLPGRSYLQQTVIYSAHWDHLGIGAPDASGDRIYNGAVDNASGDAGLLELARVFGQEPPTGRSVMFIAFTGEEKGLLGSKYYVEHPVNPLALTAAVFNMDMLSPYGGAQDVQTWGARQNTLEHTIADTAQMQGRRFEPDSHLEAGYYYRSDHFSFARVGVPAITLGSGHDLFCGGETRGEQLYQDYVAHHYHQPSDQWSGDWDLRGAALDLRLLHDTGRKIAEAKTWPEWFPASEFAPRRTESEQQRQ